RILVARKDDGSRNDPARADAEANWVLETDPLGGQFNPVRVGGGNGGIKVVPPNDTLPLQFSVTDDLGVGAAEVEYRVKVPSGKVGAVRTEAIPLQGAGGRSASARFPFKLAGKGQEGDLVFYRVRVTDTRLVPEADLKPQAAYYPNPADGVDRWFV